jgi:glyoxylase-like metal-dependent hydrolase (beta-lactamase superfamily II)
MAQKESLKVHFFASGYCLAHDLFVDPQNGKGKCPFYAVWALIESPHHGYMLFDTGYSQAFMDATEKFPDRLYRWATPIVLQPEESALQLLKNRGISASQIQYVILSHFHADHIAGLRDFPDAKIICSKIAYLQVKQNKGISAVSKGILHQLLPRDYEKRLLFIEDMADSVSIHPCGLKEFSILGIHEIKWVLLPGHAKGMLGFIFKNNEQHLFYATDAAWRYETYRKKILPHRIVNIFFDSWKDYQLTQQHIRDFENLHPESTILFTHCPKTLQHIQNVIQG